MERRDKVINRTFFFRMNPTPKEKEIKEYELGLARAALGALKRKRDVSISSEPSTSTAAGGGEGSDKADISKFESLKWKGEMQILAKRKKIETEREQEILVAKKAALEAEMNADPDGEAEDDDKPKRKLEDSKLERLCKEVAQRKVTDVQHPVEVLSDKMGECSVVLNFRSEYDYYLCNCRVMRKCENVISVLNPDFLVSSDEDELCQNTEERLHPMRKKVFRRNKSIKDDSDSDTEENTMGIPKQDLDYTLYDNKMCMYSLVRKGKVTLTKRSLDLRAVYREKHFLTVLVRNFYLCSRGIPYTVLMRGDGVGGVVGRHFLFEQKHLDLQLDSPLEKPWINLNEIRNWGERGIIFGDGHDRYLHTVPFEVGKGGRVKKFAEDKVADVIWYTNETNF